MRRIPHRAHNVPGQPAVLLAVPDTVMSNATSQITGLVFNATMPPSPFHFIPKSLDVLERVFREQSARWKKETRHLSSVAKMIAHPSYRRIIGMGPNALPFIFRELRDRPDHWLVALNAITGEDPAPPDSTFNQAIDAWLTWGVQQGYLH